MPKPWRNPESKNGVLAWLFLMAIVAGCGPADSNQDEYYEIPEGCNPLAPYWDCMLPFPSDVFLAEDSSLPSGRRLMLTEQARVYTPVDHRETDPTLVHPADGFSHLPPILALFPDGIDPANLVFHTGDVFLSLQPSSPTLLIEADTGVPVLHFAELDPRADSEDHRALILRPLVRLKNATRYVVAIHGLKRPNGNLHKVPEGFRLLRDGLAGSHPVLGPLADRYENEVFPVIEEAGVERDELQLAWDFTTGSMQNASSDMLSIRDAVVSRFSSQPPEITITGVTDEVNATFFRRVEGILRVPLFMEDTNPGARIHRDPGGAVAQNGEADVPFTLLIPRSVAERAPTDPPARVVLYGHGFFGGRAKDSEVGHLEDFLSQTGMIYAAVDWWGMTQDDVFEVIDAIASRPSEMLVFTDRVHQGMANFVAMEYALRGPLLARPEIQVDANPLYDPEQVYFYGNSQGAILGGTFLALTPGIDRGVLGVGGAAFTFMMFRARPFATFLELIETYLPDPLDVQKFVALSQVSFDRTDPITYAPHVISDPFPASPLVRRVLMQVACEDSQVPNLASHLHARALGLSLLQPSPRAVPDLEPVDSPWDGSALVEFDFGVEPVPPHADIPPVETGVHTRLRERDEAIRQIDLFFREDGQIVHTCDGVCDPG